MAQELEIKVESRNGIVYVSLRGELDMYNCNSLKKELAEKTDASRPLVVFDIEKLTHIDSSGLASLLSIQKNLLKWGGDMKFLNAQSRIQKILGILMPVSPFEFFSSFEEARSSLMKTK